MKKIIGILILTLALGGCQGTKFGTFIATIESAATGTVSPEAIYVAANTFDAVEVTATNYLTLKKCPTGAPFCRDPVATKALIPAIRSGRVARNNALQFLKDHPGQLGTQGLYDALTSATDTIKSIMNQYKVAGVN